MSYPSLSCRRARRLPTRLALVLWLTALPLLMGQGPQHREQAPDTQMMTRLNAILDRLAADRERLARVASAMTEQAAGAVRDVDGERPASTDAAEAAREALATSLRGMHAELLRVVEMQKPLAAQLTAARKSLALWRREEEAAAVARKRVERVASQTGSDDNSTFPFAFFGHKDPERDLSRAREKLQEMEARRQALAKQLADQETQSRKSLAESQAEAAAAKADVKTQADDKRQKLAEKRQGLTRQLTVDTAAADKRADADLEELMRRVAREKAEIAAKRDKAKKEAEAEAERRRRQIDADEQELQQWQQEREARIDAEVAARKRELAEAEAALRADTEAVAAAIAKQRDRVAALERATTRYKIQDVVVTGDQEAVRKLAAWPQLRREATSSGLTLDDVEALRRRLVKELTKAGYRDAQVELNAPSLELGFVKFRVRAGR